MNNMGTGCPLEAIPVGTQAQPTRNGFGKRLATFLENNKDRINTVQSLITILAIFVGGFWTYRLFIEQRQNHPRLRIDHRIQHWKISDDRVLLSVDEILTNTGSVMVNLPGGSIRVIKVMPLPPSIAADLNALQDKSTHAKAESSIYDPKVWEVLVESRREWKAAEVVIEPGESETIPNEFIIPSTVRVVAVYSFISNPDNLRLGWNGLVYYDFERPPAKDAPNLRGGPPG
jgi:hypothetical protein